MGFLKGATQFGGIGAALNPSGAAQGLGHLLNISPLGVSRFADTVGKISNGIAGAGGASAGYDAPAAPDNHMQLLDQDVIQQLVQQFGGRPQATPQGYAR
jgi:hypothetical protein